MRSWLITVTIVFLVGLSGTAWAIENPGVGSPVGPGTVPPSSIESGLVSSPNPIDTSGNLAITGNVRGAKHFRGTVPYRSITDFRESIGSSSLDSFLRDSASPEDFGRYAGGYRPYYAPAGRVMGSYRPFYSPTGMVTTTQPGRSGVFMPATTKIRDYAGSARSGLLPAGLDVGAGPEGQDLPGGDASEIGLRLWGPQSQVSVLGEPRPMSRTPQEIERLIWDELGGELSRRGLTSLRAEGATPEQYQEEMEQFQRELKRIRDEATGLKQTLAAEDESLRSFREAEALRAEIEPSESAKRLFDPAVTDSEAGTHERTPMQSATVGLDAYESGGRPGTIKGTWQSVEEMKQQIYSLTMAQAQRDASEAQEEDFEQSLGGRIPTLEKTKDVDGRDKGLAEGSYQAESLRTTLEGLMKESLTKDNKSWVPAGQGLSSKQTSILDKSDRFLQSAEGVLGRSGDAYTAKSLRSTTSGVAGSQSGVDVSVGSDLGDLSRTDLASRARAIMGEHTSISAFWQEKFDQYVAAGETYLKQGRYYRAVDAFALASIYKSDAPGAHAGRSLALFAAGEYMSSALFLSRALEIYPEYAAAKIDLAATLGNKDKLARRIADAEECLELCREPGSGLSGEAELAFLLGYVYYQVDRLGEAKKAIDAAAEKFEIGTSWLAAVHAVKKAVDDAARRTD